MKHSFHVINRIELATLSYYIAFVPVDMEIFFLPQMYPTLFHFDPFPLDKDLDRDHDRGIRSYEKNRGRRLPSSEERRLRCAPSLPFEEFN